MYERRGWQDEDSDDMRWRTEQNQKSDLKCGWEGNATYTLRSLSTENYGLWMDGPMLCCCVALRCVVLCCVYDWMLPCTYLSMHSVMQCNTRHAMPLHDNQRIKCFFDVHLCNTQNQLAWPVGSGGLVWCLSLCQLMHCTILYRTVLSSQAIGIRP